MQPRLKVIELSKSIGSLPALQRVSFEVYPGEVVGLMGRSGAGKSLLAALITGLSSPDSGQMVFEGRNIQWPFHAQKLGIEAIHQRPRLADHLDITANALSAVYCYFDENYARFSPGKFSVYKEIEIAKELGVQWLYLGYWVPGNRHTQYKLQFKPNQVMTDDLKWIDHMDASGNIINPLPFNFKP